LKKAQAYVNLRKPYLINDLKLQERLLWRHKVYETLERHNIPTPKNFVLIRDQKLQVRILRCIDILVC
jgi:inositol-hexakisphosphate/diphosphoinositol-pentakisphosphate 1-kinase